MAAGLLGCKPAAFFVVLQNFRFRFRFVFFAHYEKGLETRRILHFRVRRFQTPRATLQVSACGV